MLIVVLLCTSASVIAVDFSKRAVVLWHAPSPHTILLFKGRPSGVRIELVSKSGTLIMPVSNASAVNFGVNGSLGLRFTKLAAKPWVRFDVFCPRSVPDRYVVSTFLPDSFAVAIPGVCNATDFPIKGPATFGFFHLSGGISSVVENRLDRTDHFVWKTPPPTNGRAPVPSGFMEWYVTISNATGNGQRAFALTVSELPKQPRDWPFRQSFTKRSTVTVLRTMKPQGRPVHCQTLTNVVSKRPSPPPASRARATKSCTLSASISVTTQKKVTPGHQVLIALPLSRLAAVGAVILAVVALIVCVIASVVAPARRTRRGDPYSDLTELLIHEFPPPPPKHRSHGEAPRAMLQPYDTYGIPIVARVAECA
jgi:hypothetical protein